MHRDCPKNCTVSAGMKVDTFLWLALVWLAVIGNPLRAADISDDFNGGVGSWQTSPGWVLVEQADGQTVFRGDSNGDTFAQYGLVNLGSSWRLEVDLRFRRYYSDNNNRGVAAFALFPSLGSGVQLEANLAHRTNNTVQLDVQWFNPGNGVWSNVLFADWTASRSPAYRIQLTRSAGSDRLIFKVTGTNGFSYRSETAVIPPAVLDRLKVSGLRVNSARVEFDNLHLVTPYTLPPPPTITAHPEGRSVITGTAVTFRVAATDALPLTYQWRRGAVKLADGTNHTYTLPKVTPLQAGAYTVVVSNGETSVTSTPATLTVIGATFRPTAAARTNGFTGEGFGLEITAPTGTGFLLQQSLDLANWLEVTNAIGTGSPVEFLIPGATNHPNASYRILFP